MRFKLGFILSYVSGTRGTFSPPKLKEAFRKQPMTIFFTTFPLASFFPFCSSHLSRVLLVMVPSSKRGVTVMVATGGESVQRQVRTIWVVLLQFLLPPRACVYLTEEVITLVSNKRFWVDRDKLELNDDLASWICSSESCRKDWKLE